MAEKQEIALVQIALKQPQGAGRSVRLAIRAGKPKAIEGQANAEPALVRLPAPELKPELGSSYVPPFRFLHTPAGNRHYYNFTVTPAFERATAAYLKGDGEQAMREIDAILADEKSHPPALVWQAAHLRVSVLVMIGRPDIAERETAIAERYERIAMGGNHASRALRAEVRYWAGDTDGAIEDAAQVARAFGSWRFPTTFLTPPIDQVELARCVTAQVRANIVLGLSMLAKGQRKAALPWLELASQTMNNVLHVSRHPVYGIYFQPPEEVFWGRGMSLLSLGTAVLAEDPDSQRAETLFAQAKDFFDVLGFATGGTMIQMFKAQALSWSGKHERAIREATIGLALAEQQGFIDHIWRLEALRGQELLSLAKSDDAEKSLRRAQAILDLMAGTLNVDDSKVRFGIGKDGITHNLVRIDLRKQDLPRLFEDMERGRARSFVAMLSSRVIAEGRGGPAVEQIRKLDLEIRRERQRKNALAASSVGDAEREQRLLEERERLVARLRANDPDLADTLAVSTVDLSAVQKSLPPRTAMIYAVPVDDSEPLTLLIVTRATANLQTLKIRPPQLKALLDDFVTTLQEHEGRRQEAALESIRSALGLSHWPEIESAYIVPSGHMHFVPWAGLDTRFAIATLPTGGWVTRASWALSPTMRATIIGDPEFGGYLPQLPGAREEAIELSRLYRTSALVGDAATESGLRRSTGDGVDILHVATHALFDPYYPLQSSLILSDGKSAAPLTAESLYANPIHARMVVLSACETGMGLVASGEELLGLPRSFYLGGASAVISSLWPVEDAATKLFMETFHRHLRLASYGEAWIAARDGLKKDGFPPSAYSAFVLGGSLGVRN